MKDERMNHHDMFGETPEIFAVRIAHTLKDLKEDRPVKKSFSGVLIIAIILMLLCAAALAAVNEVGLEWFYKNIYSNHPLPEDMDNHIQNGIVQTADHPLLDLKVESVAWIPKGYDINHPEDELLEILISIQPKDPAKYEVHSWEDMSADGYGDDRYFITTPKGTGPIQKVMLDPDKALLLYGGHTVTYLVSGSNSLGLSPAESGNDYGPDGNMLYYCKYHISDKELHAMKTLYADASDMITLHYKDDSWFFNAQGAEKGLVQSGSIAFTVKLPD